ncbi:MAG: hypothetical protein FGF52_06595 [Candidatus Brockarchaeota archaeon]|nr:hypothetical protein [Candidatus Brockarchaeota archaeon]
MNVTGLKGIKTYSEELGPNLKKPEERFKWFLASMLFAKRISPEIARHLGESGSRTV